MILSSHGIIASQIQSFVGLLDTYPNAAAAYSVRKLRAAYTGSAIRVRRSSDNTEQDIGFTALGNLDESALTTFCSGTNGFITTWYDQSGNSENIVQSTAVVQPKIVNSGSVILTNGKPSPQYGSGTSQTYLRKTIGWSITNMSTFSVGYRTNQGGSYVYGRLISIAKSPNDDYENSNGYLVALCDASFNGFNPSALVLDTNSLGISYTFNTQVLISSRRNTTNAFIQSNNGSISSVASSGTTKTPDTLTFGNSALVGNSFLQGNLQENIIYLSDQSANQSAINTNINTYYGIY